MKILDRFLYKIKKFLYNEKRINQKASPIILHFTKDEDETISVVMKCKKCSNIIDFSELSYEEKLLVMFSDEGYDIVHNRTCKSCERDKKLKDLLG